MLSRCAHCILVVVAIVGLVTPATLRADLPFAQANGPRGDAIELAILPADTMVQLGDTIRVRLTILESGPAFNAYDAFVIYNPAVMTFLQEPNLADQEGPLMTGACGQTFHLFSLAPDSTLLTINHSLLCPGTSITGPGIVYFLRFRCKPYHVDTYLRFGLVPPRKTRFFLDGSLVTPLQTYDAHIRIGEGTAIPLLDAPSPLQLTAAPNPFNPVTLLSFSLSEPAGVSLRIFSLDGRTVRSFTFGTLPAGPRFWPWDGRDDRGHELSSGCYVVSLRAGEQTEVHHVTLIK